MDSSSRKWWALTAVGSGVLLSTIDGSIVNIALGSLVHAFHSNLNVVEWVMLAYLLTITCTLLLAGRLGDMFGKRRVYLGGFGVFTIASALCGLAPTIGALIAFRVFQGIGAAMLQAVGPALLVTAFPSRERGTALGAIGSFVAAGILIGPALGGVLLRYVGWEAIFFVNLPVGLIGIWLTLRSIQPDPPVVRGQVFDGTGALLLTTALLGLLLALTEGPIWGWSDPRTIGLLTLFAALGTAFVAWERHTSHPMINLRIFRSSVFSLSLLASLALFIALAFNLLLMPLFFQFVLGMDLQTTGLALMALPAAMSLSAPISGRLSDRIGPRLLTATGLVVVALSMIGLSFSTPTTSLVQVVGMLIVLGIGVGLFQSPNNSTVMGNAPAEALGVAGGLLAIMRTLGQAAGVALAGAVWTSRIFTLHGGPLDPVTAAAPAVLADAFALAMLVAAGLVSLALVPSLAGGRAWARQEASARAD